MALVFEIIFQSPVEMDVAFRRRRWWPRLVPSLAFLDGFNHLLRYGDSA